MANNQSNNLEDMNTDVNILSFVVRIWKEEPTDEGGSDLWRGHITPIPEGMRRYFTDFDEIPALIQDFIKSTR